MNINSSDPSQAYLALLAAQSSSQTNITSPVTNLDKPLFQSTQSTAATGNAWGDLASAGVSVDTISLMSQLSQMMQQIYALLQSTMQMIADKAARDAASASAAQTQNAESLETPVDPTTDAALEKPLEQTGAEETGAAWTDEGSLADSGGSAAVSPVTGEPYYLNTIVHDPASQIEMVGNAIVKHTMDADGPQAQFEAESQQILDTFDYNDLPGEPIAANDPDAQNKLIAWCDQYFPGGYTQYLYNQGNVRSGSADHAMGQYAIKVVQGGTPDYDMRIVAVAYGRHDTQAFIDEAKAIGWDTGGNFT